MRAANPRASGWRTSRDRRPGQRLKDALRDPFRPFADAGYPVGNEVTCLRRKDKAPSADRPCDGGIWVNIDYRTEAIAPHHFNGDVDIAASHEIWP